MCVSLHPLDLLTFWSAAMINWICTSSFFVDLTHHLLVSSFSFLLCRKKRQNCKLLIQPRHHHRAAQKRSQSKSRYITAICVGNSLMAEITFIYFLNWYFSHERAKKYVNKIFESQIQSRTFFFRMLDQTSDLVCIFHQSYKKYSNRWSEPELIK